MNPPAQRSHRLSEILDTHANVEAQVGEIYINFAAAFGQNPELRTLWSAMALEEGGHAALIRAVNKGLLSGVFQAKSFLLPLDIISNSPDACWRGASPDNGESLFRIRPCGSRRGTKVFGTRLQVRKLLVSASNLADLGFPTNVESKDKHLGRLREVIQQYTTDDSLRREVKFLSAERFPG